MAERRKNMVEKIKLFGNGSEQEKSSKESRFPGITDEVWIYDPEMNNYRHVSEKPAKPKIS